MVSNDAVSLKIVLREILRCLNNIPSSEFVRISGVSFLKIRPLIPIILFKIRPLNPIMLTVDCGNVQKDSNRS